MATWEVIAESMRLAHDAGHAWLSIGDVTRGVLAAAPGTNTGTIDAITRYHCINDPSKKHSAGDLYLRNPLFITDDPTMRGKRYRVLTEAERAAFLARPRTDLEQHSYVHVLEWLGSPDTVLAAGGGVTADELLVDEGLAEVGGLALLEMHLQDYLFRNWKSHFPDLDLYQGGRGKEFITTNPGVGIIDFLCTDRVGNFVVIETKRNLADRSALGQILGYMGWVAENLADGKSVRGILLVGTVSDALRLSVAAVPALEVMTYQLSFSLSREPEPAGDDRAGA